MPTAILRPSGVGTYDHWTLGAGASKTAATDPGDPLAHDDDTSYITIGTAPGANNAQSFTLDTGLPAATILEVNSVALNSRGKSNGGAGVESYSHFIRRGATDGAAAMSAPGGAYLTATTAAYARPGGGAWVPADFAPGNIQGTVSVPVDAALVFRVTSIWALLDFRAPSGGYVVMLGSLLGPVFGAGLLLREVAAATQLVRSRLLLSPDEVATAWRELRAAAARPAWSRPA